MAVEYMLLVSGESILGMLTDSVANKNTQSGLEKSNLYSPTKNQKWPIPINYLYPGLINSAIISKSLLSSLILLCKYKIIINALAIINRQMYKPEA